MALCMSQEKLADNSELDRTYISGVERLARNLTINSLEKIIKGLGISYGQEITVRDLLALIRERAPLEFCQTRCPWKTLCGVFRE